MYRGLIIVFNSFENEALKDFFVASINAIADVEICLVCNSSSDKDFEILTEIAEQCNNANVVNTKRKKSNTSSVRAGARFMQNKFNLKHLGFIVGLDDLKILEVLKDYMQHQETIVSLIKVEKENKVVKSAFLKNLFSVQEYLEKIA
ncbi:hypothetical protein [Winogradskyella sp.]|jgi:hypothetical protein|uniref:hypothetical protein n=1 Tax=Winogradskyella sp. TaxID=1883156 RepID=UPI0025F9B4C4|nr:hypothetical protein [Winogradskyella sp.]MCT4630349.1 hypothetical protein [Winogradskyella sp.]